jgi:hypothetical protein
MDIRTVEKGGPLNSYALAFGILGGGVVLAALLWAIPRAIPRLRRRTAVRRFRKALAHIDVVAMSWAQGGRHQQTDDLRTASPEERRNRRHRDADPDDGGASLV